MFSISGQPIDVAALSAQLDDDHCGAFVSFEGRVRNHNEGQAVTALEYEAYEALAVAEGARIVSEAKERYAIRAALCVHRSGRLQVGDCAVWVGVVAAHRAAAFEACRYIIDEVKQRVPIWKKEHYENGDSGWVNCSHAEHATAGRR